MNRPLVVIAPGVVAAAVLACGGVSMSSPVSPAARKASGSAAHAVTDKVLARTALADQLAATRRSLGGSWRTVGTANQGLVRCGTTAASRLDQTARAVSASLVYDNRLEIRFADYVYSDKAAANRALQSLGSEQEEACTAKVFVAETRKPGDYRVGRVDVIAPKSVRAGDEARASEIIVPATYRGRVFRFNLDSVAARKGRVIVLIGTDSSVAALSWDVKVARVMTKVPAALQRARRTGTSVASASN
jgi:hypothetical protein